MPQLSTSLSGFTQLAPHWVRPTAQVALHVPSEQNGVAPPQATPHAPQFMPLDCMSTHEVPQAERPAWQEHVLFTHTPPTWQTLPHVPQLEALFVTSVQTPQSCCVPGQSEPVLPPLPPLAAPPLALAAPLPLLERSCRLGPAGVTQAANARARPTTNLEVLNEASMNAILRERARESGASGNALWAHTRSWNRFFKLIQGWRKWRVEPESACGGISQRRRMQV